VDPSRSQTTFGDAPLRSRPLAAQCRRTESPSETNMSDGFIANCGVELSSLSAEIIAQKFICQRNTEKYSNSEVNTRLVKWQNKCTVLWGSTIPSFPFPSFCSPSFCLLYLPSNYLSPFLGPCPVNQASPWSGRSPSPNSFEVKTARLRPSSQTY